MVTLLEPRPALRILWNAMRNHGFFSVSSSPGTRYFRRPGSHLKIRVSDHYDAGENHDCIHEEVIDSRTTYADVEFRGKRAAVVYDNATRNYRKKA